MKSKEEYLVQLENRLLDKLTMNYSGLNKNLIYSFSLMSIFILFEFNLLNETSILGNKISFSKNELLIFFPILIIAPYFLINNSTLNISRIVKLLIRNSKEILEINPNSVPFKKTDLEYISQGIGGIQFQFSKWIVQNYIKSNFFRFYIPKKRNLNRFVYFLKVIFIIFLQLWEFWSRMIRTLVWLLFLVIIYIFPILSMLWFLYQNKLKPIFTNINSINDVINVYIIISICLVFIIFHTLYSNLVLYSHYFEEISDLKNKFMKGFKITRELTESDLQS